jgi:hypothetical protein
MMPIANFVKDKNSFTLVRLARCARQAHGRPVLAAGTPKRRSIRNNTHAKLPPLIIVHSGNESGSPRFPSN